MAASPLPDGLSSTSDWLVQAIDPRARLARLVRMDESSYRDASFLDDRLMALKPESRLCALDEVLAVAKDVGEPPAGWIFHIGHVGSTLVSRLIGELGTLALREPRSLRDLAVASESERPALAHAISRLMARRGGQRAVNVKATSFVSEYAPLLVEPGATALFLYASPENYLAGILAGANSVKELGVMHEARLARLRGRGIELAGFDQSDAHRAALAWACEMTSLEAAADNMADRAILWADFDSMLGDMVGWLGRVAAHFGLPATADQLQALASGPLMRRYSKAMEYDYSPSLRAELLAGATRDHLAEIGAAIAKLRGTADSVPLLDRALRRADGEL
jgi:hypothetical protein